MKMKRQENSNRKDCTDKDIREILPIVKKNVSYRSMNVGETNPTHFTV